MDAIRNAVPPSQSLANVLVWNRDVRDDVSARSVAAEISARLRGHASEGASSRSPKTSARQHHTNAGGRQRYLLHTFHSSIRLPRTLSNQKNRPRNCRRRRRSIIVCFLWPAFVRQYATCEESSYNARVSFFGFRTVVSSSAEANDFADISTVFKTTGRSPISGKLEAELNTIQVR